MPPCVAAGRGRRLGKPRPPDAPTSLCHGDHHLSPYVKCGIRAHAHAHGGEGISNTSSLRNYGGVEKKKKKKKKRNGMTSLGTSEADIFFDDSADEFSSMSAEHLIRGSRLIDLEIRVFKVRS